MRNSLMNIAAIGLLGLTAGNLGAEEAAPVATPAATAVAAPKWYDGVKFDGFVEGYYKFNPNGVSGTGSATIDRGFDFQQNTFALGGGRIGMKSLDGFATVDLYFGDYATALKGGLAYAGGTDIEIGQAFIVEALGPVNLTLGRFMTHMGYEVIDSVNNQNFTRSLLYGAVPVYHTGAKLNYAIGALGLMVQADDGINANSSTPDHYMAGGAQVSYTGVKGLALYFNYCYDPTSEPDPTDPSHILWGASHMLDFVVTYNVMDGLDLGGEYLYTTVIHSSAKDSTGALLIPSYNSKSQGYALYASYVIPGAGGLKVSPRFETWYTPDGAYQQKLDYTLTLKYAKGPITNWLEFREDASDSYNSSLTGYPMTKTGTATNSEMACTYGLTYSY